MSEVAEGTDSAPAEVESPAQSEPDWKAQARKWEDRAKENKREAEANKEAAARLAEIDEASKSETQKLQEQLAAYQERAAKSDRENARLAAIASAGIPEEWQDLVQGSDPDALNASAAKLKALIEATAAPKDRASFVIPDEGGGPNLALNGDGIESALKKALGIA